MRSPRSMGVRVPANYIPRRHSSARLALSTAARKKRQLKILGGASLPLDELVHRLADHPCGGHIITPRQRAERCVIGVLETDGDSRLLSLTLGSGHADVYCTTLLHCLEFGRFTIAGKPAIWQFCPLQTARSPSCHPKLPPSAAFIRYKSASARRKKRNLATGANAAAYGKVELLRDTRSALPAHCNDGSRCGSSSVSDNATDTEKPAPPKIDVPDAF
jgi:hypothetical protein